MERKNGYIQIVDSSVTDSSMQDATDCALDRIRMVSERHRLEHARCHGTVRRIELGRTARSAKRCALLYPFSPIAVFV